MSDDNEMPPDGERQEFNFDVEKALRDFPEMQRRPSQLVAAMCAQNPDKPRALVCLIAREFLLGHATPEAGAEQQFHDALQWLQDEAAGLIVHDGTEGQAWTADKQKNLDGWRQ